MDEILTVDEIAVRLKVSPWTIRAWRSMEYIPYFKLSEHVFNKNQILKLRIGDVCTLRILASRFFRKAPTRA